MNEITVRAVARLQGPAADTLVTLLVDDLLDRPVAGLIDPSQIAGQLIAALEVATAGPQTEAWLRKQVGELRKRVPEGTLGERMPAELEAPLREVISRPIELDGALMKRLLSHEAMERLLRDVLVRSLRAFAERLRTLAPPPPAQVRGRLGRLKALGAGVKGFSEGLVGQLSAELEQRAEQKIREFVDGAIAGTLQQVAEHMSGPEHAALYGSFRAHLLDTLLVTPNADLAREIDKLDPEGLVQTGAAVARALARRQGFEGEIAGVVRVALEATEGRSLRDYLKETGLSDQAEQETLRADLEGQLAERVRAFAATDAFAGWLDALLAP